MATKNPIPLMSHIDSVMSKIAADKKAELGTTSFKSPGDGNTPPKDGGTYSDTKKNVNANAETISLGDANKNPGGEHAGSVANITTSADKSDEKVKRGKDVPPTSGPTAGDQGAGKTASLANALLASIAELTKSASTKKAEECKANPIDAPAGKKVDDQKVKTDANPSTGVELTEEEKKAALVVKEAAEQFPDAMAGGYAFAQKVASLLVQQAEVADPAQVKVAAEAENDAIKVAEFLLGFSKTANEELASLLGGEGGADPMAGAGADPLAAVSPEAAMGGGAEMGGDAGGGMGGGNEEQIIQALADALQAQGITPEELAQALAAEQGGMGGGAAPEAGAAPAAPAAPMPAPAGGEGGAPAPKKSEGGEGEGAEHEEKESPAKEEAEEKVEKEAALRKTAGYKTASQNVSDRLADLRKKGLLKVKK
jgi:hypothetical protein